MSYDEALEHLRERDVAPPLFTEVEQRRRWKAARVLPRRRGMMAMVFSAVAMMGFIGLTVRPLLESLGPLSSGFGTVETGLGQVWRLSVATLVPAVLLAWAIALVRRDGVGPQMLARAIWWSNLVVGTLVAGNFMAPIDRLMGAVIAVACAVALLSLGSRGLEEPEPKDPFQPVRFRGQLLLALVMAFADAQTLVFSSVMQLRVGMQGWNVLDTVTYAGPATLAAAVMVLAVWGIYHLRTWALLLNLLANFAIAYLAMEGTLNVAGPVAAALAGTAAFQAFLPVPILAMALGERRAGQPLLRGHAHKLLPVSVVLIAGVAVVAGIRGGEGSGWLTGPGRSFRRGLELDYWDGRRLDLSGADLSGQDLHDRRLNNAILRGADLRGVTGPMHLSSAILNDADLRDAQLAGSAMGWAELRRVDLRGADLSGTSLQSVALSGADLRGANLALSYIGASRDPNEELRWEGATCPDRSMADPERGCDGHTGTVPAEDRKRWEGTFERVSYEWTQSKSCHLGGDLRKAIVNQEHYLNFLHDLLVQTGDGRFESLRGMLRYEHGPSGVTLVYQRYGCGEQHFVRL